MRVMREVVIVEIRAAEGGADAKLLVRDQIKIYDRLAKQRRL
jgi:protein subunit release factor A